MDSLKTTGKNFVFAVVILISIMGIALAIIGSATASAAAPTPSPSLNNEGKMIIYKGVVKASESDGFIDLMAEQQRGEEPKVIAKDIFLGEGIVIPDEGKKIYALVWEDNYNLESSDELLSKVKWLVNWATVKE